MGRSTHAGRPQKVSGRLTDPPARPGRPVSPDRGMTGRVKTPDRRPGRPRPARRPAARALDDRGAAPPPRHHVRRGRRPAPHRRRSQCHGDPAQPGHRRAELGGSGQHRRRAAPPRSRPTPIPHHPRHHGRELQMKRTSRQNDGALGRAQMGTTDPAVSVDSSQQAENTESDPWRARLIAGTLLAASSQREPPDRPDQPDR